MSRISSISDWLLRQSFIWGGLACLTFYAFVVQNAEQGSFLARYFAGHTIAYCTTTLFFIGSAALVIKLMGLSMQLGTVDSVRLPTDPMGLEDVDQCPALLTSLGTLSNSLQDSYLVRRLREALQYVQRKSSADSLESHLRYLEETDVGRMHQSYALVRIIASTIPILGFLGTVIGITLAISQLDLSADALDQSLPAVVSGLSVAFDTTALALGLSTILLFVKFCVERVEFSLLSEVDQRASSELIGRFKQFGSENDPHLASVRRIAEQVLTSVESGMEKQAMVASKSFEQSSKKWNDILANTASLLDEALSGAVVEGLTRHAEILSKNSTQHASDMEGTLVRHAEILSEGIDEHTKTLEKSLQDHTRALQNSLTQHTDSLTTAERKLAEENRQHLAEVEAAVGEAMLLASERQEKLIERSESLLQQMQTALVEAAGTTVAQQEQLIKQGDILLKVVEATGQIKSLEEALNANLNALANAHGFHQTAAGLSAALQLLGAQLGQQHLTLNDLDLGNSAQQNQAA